MRVGILGSGLMGGKLGTIFARAGHEVVFSYARSEQKLKVLARHAKGNVRAGTPREAAQEADAVLLAVHWLRIKDVLNQTEFKIWTSKEVAHNPRHRRKRPSRRR
jgi:8-hydroxy-5-deazaflavin:NADPH oxidoreductase